MGKNKKQILNTLRLRDGTVIELRGEMDRMDFAQTLRDAIAESGLTQYQLSKVTGIAQSALSKFLSGGEIRLDTFSSLANLLGFELRQLPERKPMKVEDEDS